MNDEAAYTGTEFGMTDPQLRTLEDLLVQGGFGRLHHGDCVGGDGQAHDAAMGLGVYPIIHPPLHPSKRAFKPAPPGFVREPKDYLARDRDMVDEGRELLAAPWETIEPARNRAGGVWYTVRYANKVGKPVTVIWPDGTFTRSYKSVMVP